MLSAFVWHIGWAKLWPWVWCAVFVAHTHTHPFNSPLSGTTQVSRYQKGETKLDFSEAKDSEWQWHQLGHMQVCTSIQTDNHASTHCSVFTGRMPFLPPNQQRQSTGPHCTLYLQTAIPPWYVTSHLGQLSFECLRSLNLVSALLG